MICYETPPELEIIQGQRRLPYPISPSLFMQALYDMRKACEMARKEGWTLPKSKSSNN